MQKAVLAADLGGTNLRMSVIAGDGQTIYRTRMPTPVSRRRDEIIAAIASAAVECRRHSTEQPVSAGVAIPAIMSADTGRIFSSPNLPELNEFDLAAELRKRLDLPVILENDANAAALGEQWLGASRGVASSICVTLGTGVGGGLIVGGKPLRGIDGTAGEIGHINVERDGHPCGCGSRGCVEQYSSATAIVRMASELRGEFPQSAIAGFGDLTPVDVFNAGAGGDELALEVFRRVGIYLGTALAGLINVLNPEAIVIGGGVAAAWDLFIRHTREEIAFRAFREPAERARLVRAELGDDAGIIGVAHLALQS